MPVSCSYGSHMCMHVSLYAFEICICAKNDQQLFCFLRRPSSLPADRCLSQSVPVKGSHRYLTISFVIFNQNSNTHTRGSVIFKQAVKGKIPNMPGFFLKREKSSHLAAQSLRENRLNGIKILTKNQIHIHISHYLFIYSQLYFSSVRLGSPVQEFWLHNGERIICEQSTKAVIILYEQVLTLLEKHYFKKYSKNSSSEAFQICMKGQQGAREEIIICLREASVVGIFFSLLDIFSIVHVVSIRKQSHCKEAE